MDKIGVDDMQYGKWYVIGCYGFKHIIKMKEHKGDNIYVLFGRPLSKNSHVYVDGLYISTKGIQEIREATFAEVKEYFPDEAVKLSRDLQWSDIQVDRWYKWLWCGDAWVACKVSKIDESGIESPRGYWISHKLEYGKARYGRSAISQIEEITEQEAKDWYEREKGTKVEQNTKKEPDTIVPEVGKYYSIIALGQTYLFLCDNYPTKNIKHIHISEKCYYIDGWSFWTAKSAKNLRLATLEEEHWLKECIKQDKYVPLEETKAKVFDTSILYTKETEKGKKLPDLVPLEEDSSTLDTRLNRVVSTSSSLLTIE